MKIAICFSGQLRNVKETFNNFKQNLLIPNGIEDIFIHTWNNKPGDYVGNTFQYHYTYEDVDNFILENYKPKVFIKENNDIIKSDSNYQFSIVNHNCAGGIHNVQSQLYGINKVKELKDNYCIQNNMQYDCVIRARFDLEILEPIIINELDLSILNITSFQTNENKLGDIFAISNNDVMNKYMSVWKDMPSYLDKICFHPETIQYYNAIQKQIRFEPTLIWFKDHKLYNRNY